MRLLAILLFAFPLLAQTGNAGPKIRYRLGNGTPTMDCVLGEEYFQDDASPKQRTWFCVATNTWEHQNGTAPSAYGDIVALWTTCTGYLKSDGTCDTPGGLANPMAGIGDLIYGGTSGTPTKLVGDTSNTRRFLRELSVTGNPAAPVWDVLGSSDIPANAANTSGKATTAGTADAVTSISTHASTELSDTAGLVRGAAALTTDHKVVSVSATDGTLEEIPNQTANYVYAGPATGAAAAPTFRALVSADIVANAANTSGTAGGLSSTLVMAQGGTGTASTLTGLLRGSASAMTAAELSGDVTTSASNSTTLAPRFKARTCIVTIGDPGAASAVLADDNDSPVACSNEYGGDWTITTVACWADGGSPTVTPILTAGSATSILTGALTCGTAGWAAGTVQGTPPVVHTFSSTGATCTSAPCTIDVNITAAGGVAKYIVVKITGTI